MILEIGSVLLYFTIVYPLALTLWVLGIYIHRAMKHFGDQYDTNYWY